MSIAISISASDKRKFERDLSKFVKGAEASVEKSLAQIAAFTVLDAKKFAPVNFGKLKGSIRAEKKNKLSYEVGTNTGYGLYVEFGRKPGTPPPIAPILDWVKKKKIAGTYSIKTKQRSRAGGKKAVASQNMGVAKAIQKSIGKKGTQPHPFLRPGFERAKRRIFTNLRQNFKK